MAVRSIPKTSHGTAISKTDTGLNATTTTSELMAGI